MQTLRSILKSSTVVALAALVMAGCGQKEETPAPATPPPPQKTERSTESPTSSPSTTVAKPVTTKPVTTTVMPSKPAGQRPVTPKPALGEEPTVASLEAAYTANPDVASRVDTIHEISDLGTPEAIGLLGRIFHSENDPELKVEVLDSLFDIDEQDDKKAALFAAGASANQPKDVRESAIDGLGDIDAKYALPILQALVNDPDPDIREQVKDAIEQFQAEAAEKK